MRRSVCTSMYHSSVQTHLPKQESGGTEVTRVFKNLPPGLLAEDNEDGLRLSPEQLARRFE